jgi:hypothetical protein
MMRPFTPPEERALVKLDQLPGNTTLNVTRDQPAIYQRLSDRGLTVLMLVKRQKLARLTTTGRYYAQMIAARRKPGGLG